MSTTNVTESAASGLWERAVAAASAEGVAYLAWMIALTASVIA